MTRRIMTIYGTRPEGIKVAPVVLALDASNDLESLLVTTRQHRDMLEQVNRLFGLLPDHALDVFAPGQTLNSLASRLLAQLDPVVEAGQPAAVLVQGDTTTALTGAMAAFHREIPVVHLEAGLRSGNLHSPFPEEANRRMISQLATLHLAPTDGARSALIREGVSPAAIVVTGNTVIDALLEVTRRGLPFADRRLAELEESGRPLLVVTVHRRESWGQPLENVGRAVRRIALAFPHLTVVIPLHLNPLVRNSLTPSIEGLSNVLCIEPLPYADFARLLRVCHLVLTDSGGVQEEAPALGKPVLVLRENTERPEAVIAGTVQLVGTDEERVFEAVRHVLTDAEAYSEMAHAVNPYGDGHATARAMAALRHLLGNGERLPDFAAAIVPPHLNWE